MSLNSMKRRVSQIEASIAGMSTPEGMISLEDWEWVQEQPIEADSDEEWIDKRIYLYRQLDSPPSEEYLETIRERWLQVMATMAMFEEAEEKAGKEGGSPS